MSISVLAVLQANIPSGFGLLTHIQPLMPRSLSSPLTNHVPIAESFFNHDTKRVWSCPPEQASLYSPMPCPLAVKSSSCSTTFERGAFSCYSLFESMTDFAEVSCSASSLVRGRIETK